MDIENAESAGAEEHRGRFVGVSDADREALVADIHQAFGQVTLGRGYSWAECEAIDGYEDGEARRAARDTDERRRWQELVDDREWEPFVGYGGFCFQNQQGFRNYLPPTMIRFLRGRVTHWYADHLLEFMGTFITAVEISFEIPRPLYTPLQLDCIARFVEAMTHYIEYEGPADPEDDYALIWGKAYETAWKMHRLTDESRAALRRENEHR